MMQLLMKSRLNQIDAFMEAPIETQEKVLIQNLYKAKDTKFGHQYNFSEINNYEEFAHHIPLFTYEEFSPWIEETRKGIKDIIWPGKTKWFAKSSGTTNDKSKFIPITEDSLQNCHYAAGKMMFALYLRNYPDTQIFKKLNLRIGGSSELYEQYETRFGDLSAILIDNLPFYAEMKNTPNKKISLMAEWESKMEAIIEVVTKQDIGSLTGVPSWMLVILNQILAHENIEYLDDLWPNLEVFFHGGISFKPYVQNYNQLTRKQLNYCELYNASEGFFGIQDQKDSNELLLLLDNGIFYEFIPMSTFGTAHQTIIPLEDVKTDENYALIITTNGGLWRYMIGDTIQFTCTSPYRVKVTGRTKHFINAFGEELIIDNAEEALQRVCEEQSAIIKEYTAAPIYMEGKSSGAHEWLIEFDKKPDNLEFFAQRLDEILQQLNSDYEAKRYKNMTLNPLKLHLAKDGLFFSWMKQRGKLGGQNKVPRLSNDRTYLDPLLELNE